MSSRKSRSAKRAAGKIRKAPRTKRPAPPKKKSELGEVIEWLLPVRESSYTKLISKTPAGAEAAAKPSPPSARKGRRGPERRFASQYQRGRGEDVLARVPREFWLRQIEEFRKRKAASPVRSGAAPSGLKPGTPVVPGSNNWIPLGPSVQARGSAEGRPPVSGRIPGIAIAPGITRMYVATACGGVWRSDTAGVSWTSTMDGTDLNAATFASSCLACGAIAIDPADPDRVYVGTGEGDTDAIFSSRLTNALPAYRGVGPIRSDDGGSTWVSETSTPSLAGFSFYQIAVDPANRDHCVAATSNGLYERIPSGGAYVWQQRMAGNFPSVVATSLGGVTQWFAAQWAGSVYSSSDGVSWSVIGSGFPTGNGRIALGAQPDNPNVLYALVATSAGALQSVQRLDGAAGAWHKISGAPALCPGNQGSYDLCIAVDPNNANLICLGGDRVNDPANGYPGSIYCCTVSASAGSYSMTPTAIGETAHADVHVLVFAPGNSNSLWVGCDGGLFLNVNPSGAGAWTARNTGLASLCTTHFAQHPTEPAILFCGLQDNGSAKSVGEEAWTEVLSGDGGYCVINWNNPFSILLYADGGVYRATDGAIDFTSWTEVTPSTAAWYIMESPLVGAPYNPSSAADANFVAFASGSGAGYSVFISTDFASTWPTSVAVSTTGTPYSMVAASTKRLFLGTSSGEVFRLDQSGGSWTITRIDNVATGALPLTGLVSDIAIDWSDTTLSSIYICFGGSGDYRHVWHFDGTRWAARSGSSGSSTALLDIEHNAIQFDKPTGNLYVGADLGVWVSGDSGNTWNPAANGLPDAPVFDLQLHPTQRLLRASLHGRGLWEWKLDQPAQADTELLIRDTYLDTGTGVDADGRPDPSVPPGSTVVHYESPNIKIDVPTPAGYQTPTTSIDYLSFNEVIVDGSQGVGTITPPPTVHNRVYAEVHNRGRVDAASVQVMALLANASAGLPALPAGYTANVVAGTPISGSGWQTVGVVTLSALRAGSPQIAYWDLPSTMLPMPASLPGQSHYCLLVILHSSQDPFTSTQQNADNLTLSDRKVGQKNLHIVQFIGTPPPPSEGPGMWAQLDLNGVGGHLVDLVFDLRRFPGLIHVALPGVLYPKSVKTQVEGGRPGAASIIRKWQKSYAGIAERLYHEAKYPPGQYRALLASMEAVKAKPPLQLTGGKVAAIRSLPLKPQSRHTIFMRIDPPAKAKPGDAWSFLVSQTEAGSGRLIGGSRYKVVINRKA